jgi:hypothetical protein
MSTQTKIDQLLDENGAPTDKWYATVTFNNGTDHVQMIVSPLLDNRITANKWCADQLVNAGWDARDARRLVIVQNPAKGRF